MPVCREVDRREGYITEQARACAFVEAKYPQLSDDVNGSFWECAFYFGSFSLNLKTDFPSIANISMVGV